MPALAASRLIVDGPSPTVRRRQALKKWAFNEQVAVVFAHGNWVGSYSQAGIVFLGAYVGWRLWQRKSWS
jgi:hypothetical protein